MVNANAYELLLQKKKPGQCKTVRAENVVSLLVELERVVRGTTRLHTDFDLVRWGFASAVGFIVGELSLANNTAPSGAARTLGVGFKPNPVPERCSGHVEAIVVAVLPAPNEWCSVGFGKVFFQTKAHDTLAKLRRNHLVFYEWSVVRFWFIFNGVFGN